MKTIITPLGFDTSQIISFIAKDGIERGDRVIVLRPKESPDEMRGKNAFQQTKDILNDISSDIELDKIVLDTKDFQGLIFEISDIMKDIDDEIVVNLSGGVRSILVALTTVTLFEHHQIDRIYNYERIERYMREIDMPYAHCDLKDNEKILLRSISENGPITYNELVEKLGLSKSTVSRLSNILEEKRLVNIKEKGKQKEVHLSLTGRLLEIR